MFIIYLIFGGCMSEDTKRFIKSKLVNAMIVILVAIGKALVGLGG